MMWFIPVRLKIEIAWGGRGKTTMRPLITRPVSRPLAALPRSLLQQIIKRAEANAVTTPAIIIPQSAGTLGE
jgi:hypothetical protein